MSNLQDRELKEQVGSISQLGTDWFTWESDTSREKLGKEIKTYSFSLGYQDHFDVVVYQHGAEGYYSPTGACKLFRNKSLAFLIAKQLKDRSRMLNHMFGT
jgi:hypothetical protein